MEKIKARLATQGPMSFHDYMEIALYDEQHGYYSTSAQRVGQQGDYITSVSVGPCFGIILAHRLQAYWEQTGKSDTFHIIEPGAHDGALCADILTEIRSRSAEFYQSVIYHMIEVSPSLREIQQRETAQRFPEKTHTHATLADLKDLTGAMISNELLDAFPVHLIRYHDNRWWQLWVDDSDTGLQLSAGDMNDPELEAFCEDLGGQFPGGYTTEFNPSISRFSEQASGALSKGLFITIDYGHESKDYYHPDRTSGTLQTYYRHQKSDDPLCCPGNLDITSHVDFTRLIDQSLAEGFENPCLTTQSSYLTRHAHDWLLSLEAENRPETTALLRQFQTLTHPSMLGTKFLVLEMTKR